MLHVTRRDKTLTPYKRSRDRKRPTTVWFINRLNTGLDVGVGILTSWFAYQRPTSQVTSMTHEIIRCQLRPTRDMHFNSDCCLVVRQTFPSSTDRYYYYLFFLCECILCIFKWITVHTSPRHSRIERTGRFPREQRELFRSLRPPTTLHWNSTSAVTEEAHDLRPILFLTT